MSAFNDPRNMLGGSLMNLPDQHGGAFGAVQWRTGVPYQLQNQLAVIGLYRQQAAHRRQQRIATACQWFATKWRTRASEIGVQAAARLMRKQGVPCEVTVAILATR